MLQRAYAWIVSFAAHPRAEAVLALVSFLESSLSPIPPIPLLIPMCIARPDKAWRYAFICAVASVLGGIMGYGIGHALFETLGQWIIAVYGLEEQTRQLQEEAKHVWFWLLVTKGLTPIPFKLVTIVSGLISYNFWLFVAGSVIARFTFFYMFAAALRFYGENIRIFIERHLKLATFLLLFFIIGGFVLFGYV